MKVLVLNAGAKDTAIVWWFSKSKLIEELYVAPGNPETEQYAVNLPQIDTANANQVLKACHTYHIDFVFIGTEAPLLAGVVDYLNENGISTFGAPLSSLKLETDRLFAREFAKRCRLNIPEYRVFNNTDELKAYIQPSNILPSDIQSSGIQPVIIQQNNNQIADKQITNNQQNRERMYTLKPSGFALSRSIVNSSDVETLLSYAKSMLKNGPVILEDHITGLPLTITLLLDNKGYFLLPICSEYTKREHDDPSIVTGGMGAVCPVPLNEKTRNNLIKNVVSPVISQMKKENLLYKGVLTLALVLKKDTLYLVDFHLRFNDPAAQTILTLIENDAVEVINALLNNNLSSVELQTSNKSAVSVVIANKDYPLDQKAGLKFKCKYPQLTESFLTDMPHVFLGAITKDSDNSLVTTGGRCATIVGTSTDIMNAGKTVYSFIDSIECKGCRYRKDIGEKFFNSLEDGSQV